MSIVNDGIKTTVAFFLESLFWVKEKEEGGRQDEW